MLSQINNVFWERHVSIQNNLKCIGLTGIERNRLCVFGSAGVDQTSLEFIGSTGVERNQLCAFGTTGVDQKEFKVFWIDNCRAK